MLQLSLAKRVGFKIPKTRISNSPSAIKEFLTDKDNGGYIYKPFYSAYWELESGGAARLPTTDIELNQLPSDDVLRLTPGIFQEKVDKAYEVRVTIMGRSCVAVRINSQEYDEAKTDWRQADLVDLNLERIDLPEGVFRACIQVMRSVGIVFGCFDFIVTPDGSYVFLEVNEAGQFLWIEHVLTDVPLLDMMCQFLLTASPDFTYKNRGNAVSYNDIIYSQQYKDLSREEETQHIKVASIHTDIL